jgi:hypothetical protein
LILLFEGILKPEVFSDIIDRLAHPDDASNRVIGKESFSPIPTNPAILNHKHLNLFKGSKRMTSPSHIFLSYAHEDLKCVKAIADALTTDGWEVWWDRDDLLAFELIHRAVEEAIHTASCVVVSWSKHSVDSDWVIGEADEGKSLSKLISVQLDKTKPPIQFRSKKIIDFTTWDGNQKHTAYQELIKNIVTLASKPAPSLSTPSQAPSRKNRNTPAADKGQKRIDKLYSRIIEKADHILQKEDDRYRKSLERNMSIDAIARHISKTAPSQSPSSQEPADKRPSMPDIDWEQIQNRVSKIINENSEDVIKDAEDLYLKILERIIVKEIANEDDDEDEE